MLFVTYAPPGPDPKELHAPTSLGTFSLDRGRHFFSIGTSFDHARRLVDEDRVIVVVEVADGLGRGGLVSRRGRAVAHGGRLTLPSPRAPAAPVRGLLAGWRFQPGHSSVGGLAAPTAV